MEANLLRRRQRFASARSTASDDLEEAARQEGLSIRNAEGTAVGSITATAHGMRLAASRSAGEGADAVAVPLLTLDGCRVQIGGSSAASSTSIVALDSAGVKRGFDLGVGADAVLDVPSLTLRNLSRLAVSSDLCHLCPALDVEVTAARPAPRPATVPGDVLSRRVLRVTRDNALAPFEVLREVVKQEGRAAGAPQASWGLHFGGQKDATLSARQGEVSVGSPGRASSLRVHGRRRGGDCVTEITEAGGAAFPGEVKACGGVLELSTPSDDPPLLRVVGNRGKLAWCMPSGDTIGSVVAEHRADGNVVTVGAGSAHLSIAPDGVEVVAHATSMASALFSARNDHDTVGGAAASLLFDRRGRLCVSEAVHSVAGAVLLGDRAEASGTSAAARLFCGAGEDGRRRVALACSTEDGRSPELSLGRSLILTLAGAQDVALSVDDEAVRAGRNLCMGGRWQVCNLGKPFEDHHAATLAWTKDYISRTCATQEWVQRTALAGVAARTWVGEEIDRLCVSKEFVQKQVLGRMITREEVAAALTETEASLRSSLLSAASPPPPSPSPRSGVQVVRGDGGVTDLALRPTAIRAGVSHVVVDFSTLGDGEEEVGVRLPDAKEMADGGQVEIVAVRVRGEGKARVAVYHEGGDVTFVGRGAEEERDNPIVCGLGARFVFSEELRAWVRL